MKPIHLTLSAFTMLAAMMSPFAAAEETTDTPIMKTFLSAIPKPGDKTKDTLKHAANCYVYWNAWKPYSEAPIDYDMSETYAGKTATDAQMMHWYDTLQQHLMKEGRMKETLQVLIAADDEFMENLPFLQQTGFDIREAIGLCYAIPPGQTPPDWNSYTNALGKSYIQELKSDDIEGYIERAKGPVTLGVVSGWYTRTDEFKDQLRALSRAANGKTVYFIKDSELGQKAREWKIRAYPTILVFEYGSVTETITGAIAVTEYVNDKIAP